MRKNLTANVKAFNKAVQIISAATYASKSTVIGITYQSILLNVPTINFLRSFPINTMHYIAINIPKALFYLQVEKHSFSNNTKLQKLIDSALAQISTAIACSRSNILIAVRTTLVSFITARTRTRYIPTVSGSSQLLAGDIPLSPQSRPSTSQF